MQEKPSVLMVCLGNICRSTMGEGVLRHLVKQPQYANLIATIDSCGTAAYHVGEPPNSITMSVLEDHGCRGYGHAARKIQLSDFDTFDYIFAMDRMNLRDIEQLRSRLKNKMGKAKVMLLGTWEDPNGEVKKGSISPEVDDPYYGGRDGFERAYEQCVGYGKNFLDFVKREQEAEEKS